MDKYIDEIIHTAKTINLVPNTIAKKFKKHDNDKLDNLGKNVLSEKNIKENKEQLINPKLSKISPRPTSFKKEDSVIYDGNMDRSSIRSNQSILRITPITELYNMYDEVVSKKLKRTSSKYRETTSKILPVNMES